MLLAHLSDLHLRDEDDVVEFGRQLDCIVARQADHLVISGDLLDRWHPALLECALDALAARSFLHAQRLTLVHGNHDLASSGGYPRARRDLWRLALRFWDPPPLVRLRRRRFYSRVAARAPDIARHPPFTKIVQHVRLAVIDTVPVPWLPLRIARRHVTLEHARGAIDPAETAWLEAQAGPESLVLVMHHYPGEAGSFRWRDRTSGAGRMAWARSWTFEVPMDIAPEDRTRFWRAAEGAGAVAVFCGHVHRARLEQHGEIAVGLNGQSGADWAGRTIAFYRLERSAPITAEYVAGSAAAALRL